MQQEIITEALAADNVLPLHHCHWEPGYLPPSSPSFCLPLSPSILIGCQCEQAAVGRRGNSDYKALFLEEVGGCSVCQAELSKEGCGSIWVDYWLFSSPPSFLFLSFVHSFFLSSSCGWLWLVSRPPLPATVCQGDGRKASPWQIVESRSLSGVKKLNCLSQLLGMKGFGGSIRRCNSHGLVLLSPDSLFCTATIPASPFTTSKTRWMAWRCEDWHWLRRVSQPLCAASFLAFASILHDY